MSLDEMEQIQKELLQNMMSIFEIGQKKFDVSNEGMEYVKKEIITEFLNKDE